MISGFRASDIGQYGIENLDWWTDPLFGVNFGIGWNNPFSMGVSFDPLRPFEGFNTPTVTIPDLRVQPAIVEAPAGNVAPAGGVSLPASVVIDPDFRPRATVFEEDLEEPWQDRTRPTDWDYVYEQYVILNAPKPAPEVQEVLHGTIDWGSVVGTIVGGAADPFGVGRYAAGLFNQPAAALPGVPAVAAPGPAPVRLDPRTGRPVCKRRRRRRLLTDGDFNDLMRISTLPNKDIVKIALAKAVGR